MVLEGFESIFGEPRVEWSNKGGLPLRKFVYYVHVPDQSHLRIHVTDFHSNTWEAVRSIHQLEDMRDDTGVGGSWAEFIDYFQASMDSDVKLVLEGQVDSAARAKLVAQKSKGMPLIFISLVKLVDSAASDAIGNLSLQLLTAFKSTKNLLREEQNRHLQLTELSTAEKESKNTKNQKLPEMNAATKAEAGPSINNGSNDPPEKITAPGKGSRKRALTRVVPAHRRAKVRGVLLEDSEDLKTRSSMKRLNPLFGEM